MNDVEEVERIDTALRNGVASKEIAESIGKRPSHLYGHIGDQHRARVAAFKFLVDARTGRPLRRVTAKEIREAAQRAIAN